MAGVGLVIPPGSKSLANCVPPLQEMDISAHPWEHPAETLPFYEAHNRRYGKPGPGFLMADQPGLHATTVIPTHLSEIAAANPSWFEEMGLGEATGDLEPSEEEVHDAQAALLPGGRGRVSDLLAREHERLFPPKGDLVKPGGPTTGGGSGQVPPEEEEAREHVREIKAQATKAHALLRAKGTQSVGGGAYARELRDLLKVIGIMLILALSLSGCGTLGAVKPPVLPGQADGPLQRLWAALISRAGMGDEIFEGASVESVDVAAGLVSSTLHSKLGDLAPLAGELIARRLIEPAGPRAWAVNVVGDPAGAPPRVFFVRRSAGAGKVAELPPSTPVKIWAKRYELPGFSAAIVTRWQPK